MTVLLADMLGRSVLPLRPIESRCAVDSTGFRTTMFHYYRKEKYNPERENIWLKAHALVGVRTHAILSLEVNDGNAGDSPRFPLLIERALKCGFELKEALADKAYNSRKNFDVADDPGVVPIIPFKSNQTGHSKRSASYHRMFLFFSYHRDKFDEIYGDRAQAEATFGSIKQILGETIASRNFDAQVNELYCKAIAHNIRMLIHAMFDLGIMPDFLTPPSRLGTAVAQGLPSAELNVLLVNTPPTRAAVVLSNTLE